MFILENNNKPTLVTTHILAAALKACHSIDVWSPDLLSIEVFVTSQAIPFDWDDYKEGEEEVGTNLSNLYPCNNDSARIVFVEVARQPNKAAQNPKVLKLSSVIEVRRIPPTMGIKEVQILHSKLFLQTSHCKITVQTYAKK